MVKKPYIFICILLLFNCSIIFIACDTNPQGPENKNDEGFNFQYFPLKIGNIWKYNVERRIWIYEPPFPETYHEGNETWEIKNIYLPDSTIFLETSFAGIKVESDSSTHLDTIKISNSKVQIALKLKDSSLVKILDVGWPDNTSIFASLMDILRNNFKIIYPYKSDSVIVEIYDNSVLGSCTLKKGLGMTYMSIYEFWIYGSLTIKYKLIEAKLH